MRYTWDFNKFRENRNRLITLSKENINRNKKDIFLETIHEYNNLLSLENKNGSYDIFSTDIKSNNIIELIDYVYNFYNEEDTNTLAVLESLILTLPILNEVDTNKSYSFIETDDDDNDLMEWVLSFFVTMTNKKMQDEVIKIFDPKNHILNISNHKNSNVLGITSIDYINKEKYIGLCRKNNAFDISNMIHEMFHYIFTDASTLNLNTSINNVLTSEIESKFGNVLFADYFNSLNKKQEDANLNIFREYELSLFKSTIEVLFLRDCIIGSLNNQNKIRFNKLNKMLDGYKIQQFTNTDQLIPYLKEEEKELMVYSLGYLVALDLFYIYQNDREFAFYLLKNIKYNSSEDNILSLLNRNHITFMEDDYANLKKYIKEIR